MVMQGAGGWSALLLFPGWGIWPTPSWRWCISAHIVNMSAACLVPLGVWPCGPPCWRVFRRQTPACLKPRSSCPQALRAEAAGPRFCPFLSHNSCPVSHLSLPTPSACALGNIRVLCVLESLALRQGSHP